MTLVQKNYIQKYFFEKIIQNYWCIHNILCRFVKNLQQKHINYTTTYLLNIILSLKYKTKLYLLNYFNF